MKQTAQAPKERSLLRSAISKLNPGIFSHPVWLRFSDKDTIVPPETIQALFGEAEQLQRDHPSAACQVLLICAVYQNHSGQITRALMTLQKALDLAEHNNLSQEILWAAWGTCAVYVQQGNYEQAAVHFERLQAALHGQNEWMLADYVEVVKGSLFPPTMDGPGAHSGAPGYPSCGDLLALTFEWLQEWGFSTWVVRLDLGVHRAKHLALAQPLFSRQRWQDFWNRLVLAVQGNLRQQLGSSNAPHIREIPAPDVSFPILESISKKEKSDVSHHAGQATTSIPVTVHMLGDFSLTIGDLSVKLPASRGLSILKYLLLHHKQKIPREVLMDLFWPDAEPETARNNLNVAIHGFRTALRSVIFLPVIVFEDGAYGLAPDLQLWIDVEEFERYVKSGQQLESHKQLTGAVSEYETATSLYQGDFLEQDPYEEWTVMDRERLRITYLDTLAHLSQIYFSQDRYAACVTLCQLILARDRCREDAHYRLMQCYSRLGQGPLALRQYQICGEALQAELQVDPAPETTRLYEQIRRHNQI